MVNTSGTSLFVLMNIIYHSSEIKKKKKANMYSHNVIIKYVDSPKLDSKLGLLGPRDPLGPDIRK